MTALERLLIYNIIVSLLALAALASTLPSVSDYYHPTLLVSGGESIIWYEKVRK